MKFALFVFALVGAVYGFPETPKEVHEIDWSKITPNDIYVDTNSNQTPLPTDRIIGGVEIQRNSVPYQVALLMDGRGFCGGSLISPNYVLTAAHCTYGVRNIQVILGAHNVQTQEFTQQRIMSSQIITHSGYNPSTISNDIALVRLSSPATLNSAVAITPLAQAGSGNFAYQYSLLTGWGKTSDSSRSISPVLRGVNLITITNAECASRFGSSIRSTNICTSGPGNSGGCNGDSGGPLLVGDTQVGIVSFGSPMCEMGIPTVFTRVSEFQSWIEYYSDVIF